MRLQEAISEAIATEHVKTDKENLHYYRVVLRDDQVERIAKAVADALRSEMKVSIVLPDGQELVKRITFPHLTHGTRGGE